MFPDGLINKEQIYFCPFCTSQNQYDGVNFIFHLVDNHMKEMDESDTELFEGVRARFIEEAGEDKIYFGPSRVMNAVLLCYILNQQTLAQEIIKKHAKEFAMIKNLGG